MNKVMNKKAFAILPEDLNLRCKELNLRLYNSNTQIIDLRAALLKSEAKVKGLVDALSLVINDSSRPFGEIGGYFIAEETYDHAKAALKEYGL